MEKALVELLEKNGVIFEAEYGFGFGWSFNDKTDNKAYDTKLDAARAAAKTAFKVECLVLNGELIEVGTVKIYFGGTRASCLSFMRKNRKRANLTLAYLSGHLASYVL